MRKQLPSGVVIDILRNQNGDTHVDVICPPKHYESFEEGLRDEYNIIKEALFALKSEGIFSGTSNTPHISSSLVPGGKSAGIPVQKKQTPVTKKQAHKAGAIKPKTKKTNNKPIPTSGVPPEDQKVIKTPGGGYLTIPENAQVEYFITPWNKKRMTDKSDEVREFTIDGKQYTARFDKDDKFMGYYSGAGAETKFVPKLKKAKYTLTNKITDEIIAIALAESKAGALTEAKKIFWVYYNIFKEKGESGFTASYAYKGKNYKLFMTMLGENDYANDMYDKKHTYAQFAINEYVDKHDKQPVLDVTNYVKQIKNHDEENPYQDFLNNGSVEDLNAESSGAKKHPKMWNEVRTYYKLQQDKKVSDTYVVNVGEGDTSSFIFDLSAIEKYLKNNNISINNTPKINPAKGDFSPNITSQRKLKKRK